MFAIPVGQQEGLSTGFRKFLAKPIFLAAFHDQDQVAVPAHFAGELTGNMFAAFQTILLCHRPGRGFHVMPFQAHQTRRRYGQAGFV